MAKTKITQTELKQVLTDRLELASPGFHLENHGGKISGSIVSETFAGWDSLTRQNQVWDALEQEYGGEATMYVGTLLLYSPAEWNVQLD